MSGQARQQSASQQVQQVSSGHGWDEIQSTLWPLLFDHSGVGALVCRPLSLSSLIRFFLFVCLLFSFFPLVFEAGIEVRVGTHAGKLFVCSSIPYCLASPRLCLLSFPFFCCFDTSHPDSPELWNSVLGRAEKKGQCVPSDSGEISSYLSLEGRFPKKKGFSPQKALCRPSELHGRVVMRRLGGGYSPLGTSRRRQALTGQAEPSGMFFSASKNNVHILKFR